nr:immunoglobulin heavy chain junction region [Macaca mulatta]
RVRGIWGGPDTVTTPPPGYW